MATTTAMEHNNTRNDPDRNQRNQAMTMESILTNILTEIKKKPKCIEETAWGTFTYNEEVVNIARTGTMLALLEPLITQFEELDEPSIETLHNLLKI